MAYYNEDGDLINGYWEIKFTATNSKTEELNWNELSDDIKKMIIDNILNGIFSGEIAEEYDEEYQAYYNEWISQDD